MHRMCILLLHISSHIIETTTKYVWRSNLYNWTPQICNFDFASCQNDHLMGILELEASRLSGYLFPTTGRIWQSHNAAAELTLRCLNIDDNLADDMFSLLLGRWRLFSYPQTPNSLACTLHRMAVLCSTSSFAESIWVRQPYFTMPRKQLWQMPAVERSG